MPQRYFIKLSFDGSRYHGWQIQPNASTVQQELTSAVHYKIEKGLEVTGCGRTDTGVHAREFYAHIDLPYLLSDQDRYRCVSELNHFLKADIRVFQVLPVHSHAHARFSATSRTYHYNITRHKDPFNNAYACAYYAPVDVDQMNRAAEKLLGQKDFSCFSKVHTQTKTNICTITQASWEEAGERLIFKVTADRFLRNMVRAMVGTLLEIGRGTITIDRLETILALKDRSEAGASVPAKGLFLEKVVYPEALFMSTGT